MPVFLILCSDCKEELLLYPYNASVQMSFPETSAGSTAYTEEVCQTENGRTPDLVRVACSSRIFNFYFKPKRKILPCSLDIAKIKVKYVNIKNRKAKIVKATTFQNEDLA